METPLEKFMESYFYVNVSNWVQGIERLEGQDPIQLHWFLDNKDKFTDNEWNVLYCRLFKNMKLRQLANGIIKYKQGTSNIKGIGTTTERVRQIEGKALRKFRKICFSKLSQRIKMEYMTKICALFAEKKFVKLDKAADKEEERKVKELIARQNLEASVLSEKEERIKKERERIREKHFKAQYEVWK